MHKITTILIAALVSLATTGITVVWDRGRQKQARDGRMEDKAQPGDDTIEATAPPAEASAGLAMLSNDVAQLRREISALKAEVARLADAKVPDQPVLEPRADDEAEVSKQHEAMLAAVVGAFQKEPADAAWSTASKSKIGEVASHNEALRHAIRRVDCRSRTCRVELLDDASANLGQNLSLFISELTGTLPVVTTDWTKATDGTGTYVLYMGGG